MTELAIRLDGISKLYELGTGDRYKALRDTLSSLVTAPLRALRRGGDRDAVPRRCGRFAI